MEDSLLSFDGDSKRLKLDGSLHLRDTAGSDEAFGVDIDIDSGSLIVRAGTCLTGVGFGRVRQGALTHSLVGLIVVERLVLPATIAAIAASDTTNELLLGE